VQIAVEFVQKKKKGIYQKSSKSSKSKKKIVKSAGAPDQRMPPQSFLVRPEWIIQGVYPGTRRSVAHASAQLPSGSLFPSVLERKQAIF